MPPMPRRPNRWLLVSVAGSRQASPPPFPPPLAGEGRVGAQLSCFGRYDLADHQALVAGTDMNRRPVGDMALEDLQGQRVLQFALDYPLQRPGAIDRIVAGVREPSARRRVDLEGDLAVGEQFPQPLELDRDDPLHVVARQPPE